MANNKKHRADNYLKLYAEILEQEFKKAREIIDHFPTSGARAVNILLHFLNEHMPKRFSATTGFAIDTDNNKSKETDILIYDSFNSPILSIDQSVKIIFADNVLCNIEVKSNIRDRKVLENALINVLSVKKLRRNKIIKFNEESSKLENSTSIIFAYKSAYSLETLAEKLDEFNSKLPATEWVDAIVVLDKGMVTYTLQNPFSSSSSMFVINQNFMPQPYYVNLSIFENSHYSLNLFLFKILAIFSTITKSNIAYESLLSDLSICKIVKKYTFDINKNLIPYNSDIIKKLVMFDIISSMNQIIGRYILYKWVDGIVILVHNMTTQSRNIINLFIQNYLGAQNCSFSSLDGIVFTSNILKGNIPQENEIKKFVEKIGFNIKFSTLD